MRLSNSVRALSAAFGLVLSTGLAQAGPMTVVSSGTVTVGDSVSDLNLTGDIVYAIDNFSPVDRVIGGVTFEGTGAGPIAGYTSAPGGGTPWGGYDIGATASDNNLEALLADIDCCATTPGSPGTFDFAVANGKYRIQLLWGEKNTPSGNDNTRVWDVRIEGNQALDEVNVVGLLGPTGAHVHPDAGSFDFDGDGSITDQFTIYTTTAFVTDGNLDIDLGQIYDTGGQIVAADRNYVLSGMIITAVPEPATFLWFVAGAIGWFAWRHRRTR